MRYYLDTEFNEQPGRLELISIGLVADDGREFYAELPFDPTHSNPWVRQHVWPHLQHPPLAVAAMPGSVSSEPVWVSPPALDGVTPDAVAGGVLALVGSDPAPRFVTYYGAYDWVAFCWLFGAMADLPPAFPMYPFDLQQVLEQIGHPVPPVELQSTVGHHALADARFHRRLHQWCLDYLAAHRPELVSVMQ